ncbi:peptidyl-prolyl cis-trans isomerase FKBP3-like [Acanthaster planci]|uniref:peptidylprolyl isomerase n=1 Tax=Acanthaster planci TaxID=133434 RepID=A0A8B7YI73_ACAPL|nr:peptidyl-prolyl cis-trans isomerase FKBP3-like [Acanthaster planci]
MHTRGSVPLNQIFSVFPASMAAENEVTRPWTDEEIVSDDIGKKAIATFLQEHASKRFLRDHKMLGALKHVVKTCNKDQFVKAYKDLFEKKAFKGPGDDEEELEEVTKKTAEVHVKPKPKEEKVAEVPHFTKKIVKQGDKSTFPKKGDYASVWYTGKLTDGTVFDTNITTGKKKKAATPLKFKVGTGQVIRGWDEGVLTMSLNEKAELTIQPDWAYGKKGKPESKIPPNATLIFEVELIGID